MSYPEIILLHSPLVGPASVAATAAALRGAGHVCRVPAVAAPGADIPAWRDWPARLAEALPGLAPGAAVAGHSLGAVIAPRLATLVGAGSVICLDGVIPPASGPAAPVEGWFLEFIDTLPVTDGRLPKWHEWWGRDMLAEGPRDAAWRAAFVAELPRIAPGWYRDAFEMTDWSHLSRGYIRLSEYFDADADLAEADGWRVVRLDGAHMDPAFRPAETAAAILEILGTTAP